ncbi:TetR/AcrR family transcriptional regulator [Billgrantia gudaonensis]|uniref:Transcriptional regulator, TetR family n=1 Tax=Billgrantia gudaonensis TaxID=376427 RepID=A0A1G9EF03_9GAMM|nr:TetR/AcrR family transcriptional regulator [Halomonas gudaonensis]SDK74719.1 transcriptional regulator, TetR family [Halomonas gudaonensis]
MATWKNTVPNRDQLYQAKRDALLREAVSAFNQKGFHATSMEDIGKSLGVTKAALYYYFPNKHALLAAAFEHVLQVAFESLEQAKQGPGTGFDKLKATIRGYLESTLSELNRCVILTEEHALQPEQRAAIVDKRDRFEEGLRELVREGIADGSIISCDPKLAIFAIFGAVNWVPKWFSNEGDWNSAQLAYAMSELICRSIAAKPTSTLASDVSRL